MQRRRELQQFRRFLIDGDRTAARGVDGVDDVPPQVTAVLFLDAPGAVGDAGRDGTRLRRLARLHEDLARPAHRPETPRPATLHCSKVDVAPR